MSVFPRRHVALTGQTETISSTLPDYRDYDAIAVQALKTIKYAPSYTVYKVGSTYYAMDEDGVVISNADLQTLYQTLLTNNVSIHFKNSIGNATVNDTLTNGGFSGGILSFERGVTLTAKNALNTPVIKLSSCSNWTIETPSIDGNAVNQGAPNGLRPCGIEFDATINCKVINPYINNTRMFGFYTHGVGSKSGILGGRISNSGWNGITLAYGGNHCDFAIGVEVDVFSDVGITVYDNHLVRDCYVHDATGTTGYINSQWGIGIEGGSGSKILSNVVDNVKVGIAAQPALAISDFNISDNTITRWDKDDGYLEGISIHASNGIVSRNQLKSALGHGVGMLLTNSASNNRIFGNILLSVPNAGIAIDSDSDNNKITDNDLLACGYRALEIKNANCNLNTFSGNDCSGSVGSVADSGTGTRYGINIWHDGTYDNTPP
jgi:parallel beta-helix repeat protein